jgi:hypothetical protein
MTNNRSKSGRDLILAFTAGAAALGVASFTSACLYKDITTQQDARTVDDRFFIPVDYGIAALFGYGAYRAARPARRRETAPTPPDPS